MFKRLKSWGAVEIERLKAGNIEETKQTHTWIARIWSNDTLGQRDYLFSVPFDTKKQVLDLKRVLKCSRSKYRVTEHKVELDGEYIA
jgi:hypothetical protein